MRTNSRCVPAVSSFFVLGERDIGINRHAVEIAKRRHGTEFAVRKCVFEFALRSQFDDASAGQLPETAQVHVPRCREHYDRQDTVDFDDDRFRQLLAGDMHKGGNSLGGVSKRGQDTQVLDVMGVEELAKLRQRHTTSSLVRRRIEGPVNPEEIVGQARWKCCAPGHFIFS